MKTNKLSLLDMKEKIRCNDPCFCGSGEKYKKCCITLTEEKWEEEGESAHNSLIQIMREIIETKYENKHIIFETSEETESIEMSDVIYEFAEDLLDNAITSEGKEDVLILAVVAWNITIMFQDEPKNVDHPVEDFLQALGFRKKSEDKGAGAIVLLDLIEKKRKQFQAIKRYVVDF